jgi:hypothetical protein
LQTATSLIRNASRKLEFLGSVMEVDPYQATLTRTLELCGGDEKRAMVIMDRHGKKMGDTFQELYDAGEFYATARGLIARLCERVLDRAASQTFGVDEHGGSVIDFWNSTLPDMRSRQDEAVKDYWESIGELAKQFVEGEREKMVLPAEKEVAAQLADRVAWSRHFAVDGVVLPNLPVGTSTLLPLLIGQMSNFRLGLQAVSDWCGARLKLC